LKNNLLLVILLVLLLGATFNWFDSMTAQSTIISVINEETGDRNFTFYSNMTFVGDRFNATICWVYNVTDLYGYQLNVTVNDAFLNITRVWIPEWDYRWVFINRTSHSPGPIFYDANSNNVSEAVLLGSVILGPDPSFNGSGLLAVIEFEIIQAPGEGEVLSCLLAIDNLKTYGFLEQCNSVRKNGWAI